jgi:hypothetical protein
MMEPEGQTKSSEGLTLKYLFSEQELLIIMGSHTTSKMTSSEMST